MDYVEELKERYPRLSLTVAEVAIELNVSERMIRDRVRASSAEIPAFKKVGGVALFPIKKVAYFLENDFIKVM